MVVVWVVFREKLHLDGKEVASIIILGNAFVSLEIY